MIYSPQSIKAYMGDLEQFVEWLKTRRVDWDIPYRIQRIDIVEFINFLASRKATAVTRKRKLAAIRGFFKFLKDNEIIFGSPADTIEGPIREERDPAILLKTEYKALLQVAGGNARDFAIVMLSFDHGVGHPLLLLYDAKAPNCRKNKVFKGLGHYSEWPKVVDAVIKAGRKAWRKHRMTVMWVNRAFQAPCVACQPSVLPVSGAYSASRAYASLAKTPYAFSKAAWEADRATDAPKRQSCAAVVAMYTRSPFNQLCFSSATRSLGKRSGCLTVVPTTLKRLSPCSRRYQYIASRPNT